MKNRIKTLVLDDNEVLARKFSGVVSQWEDAVLVGCFFTLSDALDFIRANEVDLLITDINLPDGSGVTAIELMTLLHPQAQSIVISVLSEKNVVVDAIKAGAVGYLSKDDTSMNVLASLKSVIAGNSPISVNIARHILTMLKPDENAVEADEHSDVSLTARQTDVLFAISKGYTYREIAKLYGISHQTVPVHVRNIYRKLQVKNRSEATYEATRLGLIGS